MASKVLLVAFVVIFVRDAAQALLCSRSESVPFNMDELTASKWYPLLFINGSKENGEETCTESEFDYDRSTNRVTMTRTSISRSGGKVVTVADGLPLEDGTGIELFNRVHGETYFSRLVFLEFTPGESFVIAICEIRGGKQRATKVAVDFTTRDVDSEQVHKKLRSAGLDEEDEDDVMPIPQSDCD